MNTEEKSVWNFIEKYYPDYYRCQDIADNDDMCKIINGENEEGDCSDRMFRERFENNLDMVYDAFTKSNEGIYERAIMGFINQHPELV